MDRLKKKRSASFMIIAFAYIIALFVAIFTYKAFAFDFWISLLLADIAATIVIFLFSIILGNASVYDPYWSVQPPVILLACAVGRKLTVFGFLLIFAVTIWGIRLTVNWAYTFKGLCHQDWRYTMLKEKTGSFYPLINFLGIHMVPTLVVYGCILPGVYAIGHDLSSNLGGVLFLCLSLGATIIQGLADFQMHKFRKKPAGKYINTGLWKYSRHPNYLGEILMWWGIALCVISVAPDKWYFIFGAVANTVLFLAVSIPMAEKRQSRKGGFEEYKSKTRMLLPIPK